jgi:putative transposase
MRVVGLWNPETQRYHCYVTNLSPQEWSVEDLATLYRQRWIIETCQPKEGDKSRKLAA